MALYQITNCSGWILLYDEAYIELNAGSHWEPDPGQLPWTDGICAIGASNSATILLPTPTNQGLWRCKLVLKEVDTTSVFGNLRNAAANLGIASRKRHEVVGPDVAKE
jgi:hypothetical protein